MFGSTVGNNLTGANNIAIGNLAATNSVTSGASNIIIGPSAAGTLQTGSSNLIIGASADTALASTSTATIYGRSAKGGSQDTAIGASALSGTTTNSNNNTAVGYQAGSAGTAITTGTGNTLLGFQAQVSSATATNRTVLGNLAIGANDNDVVLGNSSVASIHAQVTSITAISDRRLKTDIAPIDLGLDFIMKLQPVSYRLKSSDYVARLGFVAQDTEKALPRPYQVIVQKRDPKDKIALLEIANDKAGTYQMNYGELIAPLVRAVQEQQGQIETLKSQLAKRSGK